MRARLMLLTASPRDEITADWAERILIDLSAAFGHSFSLMRQKIGPLSVAAYGEALTEEAVLACQECQGVFLCGGEAEGARDLLDELDLPLAIRCLSVPEALCGRHEAPVSLYVGTVLSLDADTVGRAMRLAFQFVQEQDCRLCAVPPTGPSRQEWDAAVRAQAAQQPKAAAGVLAAPEAVAQMISAPERMGLLLCPPYAGSILLSAATALCTHPDILHEMAFDESIGVYAPCLPAEEEPRPFSAALALAKMLRFSLRLPREAACLEAAVGNVLSQREGAERAVPDGEKALALICEQISVAGELMQRAGI